MKFPSSLSNLKSGVTGKYFRSLVLGLVFLNLIFVNLYSAFETFADMDARTRAIAGANAAIPVSGSVIVINPALLPSMRRTLLTLTVAPRGLGLNLGDTGIIPLNLTGSFVLPTPKAGTFGVALSTLFVNNDNLFGYSEYQLAAAWGIKIIKNFAVGVTVMGQYWAPDDKTGTLPTDFKSPFTLNANLGFHFEPYEQVSIGLVGVNLIRMNTASGGYNNPNFDGLSRSIVLGLAYTIFRFVIALDSEFVFDNSQINLKFGGETFFGGRRFHAGIGLEMQGPTKGIVPSIGFGVFLAPFVIDYAFAYPLNVLGAGNHLLSLTLAF